MTGSVEKAVEEAREVLAGHPVSVSNPRNPRVAAEDALRALIAALDAEPLRLALAEATSLRDLHWREVESLRERLDKEGEERGRQYGLRVQAEAEVKRLTGLVQHWYEGRARIGAHMTFVDQRFYDAVRCQRTGWPGDDANGDGGPPEE